jgi:hypothetical protein
MNAIPVNSRKLAKWLDRLRSPDEARRIHAAIRLTTPGLDVRDAVPVLEAALSDPDAEVGKLAAWVLARIKPAAAAA